MMMFLCRSRFYLNCRLVVQLLVSMLLCRIIICSYFNPFFNWVEESAGLVTLFSYYCGFTINVNPSGLLVSEELNLSAFY